MKNLRWYADQKKRKNPIENRKSARCERKNLKIMMIKVINKFEITVITVVSIEMLHIIFVA